MGIVGRYPQPVAASLAARLAESWAFPNSPAQTTFAEMRADCWPDDFRYPTLEQWFSSAGPAARRVQMSIIPKLAILGLAAALGSTVTQHQIDFSMPGSHDQHLNQILLVTWIEEAGVKVVVQAKLTDGSYTPLIAADASRLESALAAAQYGNGSQDKIAPDQIYQSRGSRRHCAITSIAKTRIGASGKLKQDQQ
jgi:hypothetical protein